MPKPKVPKLQEPKLCRKCARRMRDTLTCTNGCGGHLGEADVVKALTYWAARYWKRVSLMRVPTSGSWKAQFFHGHLRYWQHKAEAATQALSVLGHSEPPEVAFYRLRAETAVALHKLNGRLDVKPLK